MIHWRSVIPLLFFNAGFAPFCSNITATSFFPLREKIEFYITFHMRGLINGCNWRNLDLYENSIWFHSEFGSTSNRNFHRNFFTPDQKSEAGKSSWNITRILCLVSQLKYLQGDDFRNLFHLIFDQKSILFSATHNFWPFAKFRSYCDTAFFVHPTYTQPNVTRYSPGRLYSWCLVGILQKAREQENLVKARVGRLTKRRIPTYQTF